MKKSESVAATPILSDALQGASGPVTIPMTNDYLFRALLQSNNRVLKGLICSLLHMAPKQIKSVTITNPIELGKAIDAKTLILDVKVLMNNDTTINLEMQVINEHNWPERSLTYLCRSFDSLNTGEAYLSVKPVIQISLLDFTLFPENPEFYATYRFLNEKNHMIYSDKLRISVLDLTRIDLATVEDRMYGIDHWAALFKSGTWEEIRMLAQENEDIREASGTIYQLTREEDIRQQCEAREDYYRRQRSVEIYMQKQEDTIRQQRRQLAEKDGTIAALLEEIKKLKEET